jgi:hypothetical protein
MTRKVLNICLDGTHLECIRTEDKRNPFRVYRVSVGHREQIAKHHDFLSVICFLKDFYQDGADTMTTSELTQWVNDRSVF